MTCRRTFSACHVGCDAIEGGRARCVSPVPGRYRGAHEKTDDSPGVPEGGPGTRCEGVDPMGRGRAKAKQTKVARELKYREFNTDFSALQRELHGDEHDEARDDTETSPDGDLDASDDAYVDGVSAPAERGQPL
jgi:hypothetical protein